ncbi:MAG: hypothetical protein DPW18_07640 [Chloroflexi bacterium]|nr:hypothetical protein [Chloroflexota bacterium]MDL1941537.1 glycosyltransferase family 4 protein [Chloroflexi bacterium CFX2]
MKILMTSHYTLPHQGGIEIIIEKLSSALAARGHEIKVVASRHGQLPPQKINNREIINVSAFDPLRNAGVHYPIFSPALIPIVYRAVRWADIIHAQGMLYQNTLLALWLAKLSNKPTVLTEHAGFVQYNRPFFNKTQRVAVDTLGRASLSLSKSVVVPDTIVREILVNDLNVPENKVAQIPLGVDTDVFHPVSTSAKKELRRELNWDNRPKVLFVGNFVARKRTHLLLDALSDQFDVVLCGEGTPPSPLPERVRIYPAMGHERIVKLYQAADVFVIPSSVETFSIVAYEAMACGLPVIMTEDLAHLTVAKSNLVKITPPNSAALQKQIHGLINDPGEIQRIGLASAEWVQKNFSWNTSVNQHLNLYERLLAGDSFS